jgi:hypothetical protein
MARGLFRKTSFNKMVGAYRSQWKRFWMRLFTFGMYGRKGMGWWRDPKKAWYNWWYHRTSISIPRLLGYKPSRASFFCAMLVASVISIFAAPVDATRAGVKAHKIKAERKARSESSGTRTSTSSRTNASGSSRTNTGNTRTSTTSSTTSTRSTSSTESKPRNTSQSAATYSTPRSNSSSTPSNPRNTAVPKLKVTYTPLPKTDQEEKPKSEFTYSSTIFSYETTKPVTPIVQPESEVKEPDENTPKSKPKHEGDQYIRKRMIIAGSSYCDKSALDKLTIGTYFELVAEPTNPYDKDAVMLVHDGEKIGYIAKQDKLAFVTCLKLKRRIYGVITDIITEPYPTKYEFETWFDSVK